MNASPLALRAARALGAAVIGAALLAACGGGTTQVDQFQPDRVLSFGDELNLLTASGTKYTVNALKTDKSLDCSSNSLWVQYLAATAYSKRFSQCPGTDSSPDLTAYAQSSLDARVDDVVATLQAKIASGDVGDGDLVLVLVGLHDVLDQYALYDGSNEADLKKALETKGEKLASQVNAVTGSGAKVLVSTTIDLGLTPYALDQKANVGDDRPGLLTRLTDSFNKAMRLALINDGSKIGLLLADDLVRGMVKVPSSYGLGNTTTASCLQANWRTATCTTDTLIDAAKDKSSTYLWADDLHPGPNFQLYLGQQAVSRVRNLPF